MPSPPSCLPVEVPADCTVLRAKQLVLAATGIGNQAAEHTFFREHAKHEVYVFFIEFQYY